MNGERAWIIGAAPVVLQLSIFNTDSGEDQSIPVNHDTKLSHKYFVSHTISFWHMIISSSEQRLMHLSAQNNDDISMQAPVKDFDHCTRSFVAS